MQTDTSLTPQEERTWAAVAHASILLNLSLPLVAIAVPLTIYLVYRRRSRYLAEQSLQAVLFQLVTQWLAGLVLLVLALGIALLSVVLIGLLCIPFFLLIAMVPLAGWVYGIIAAVETYHGRPFRYQPWIGEWALALLPAASTAEKAAPATDAAEDQG